MLKREKTSSYNEVKKRKNSSFERAQARAFYVIMIPFVLFLLITKGYPIAWRLYISLTNFTGYNLNDLLFVGFDNFKRVFTDTEAIPSIIRVLGIGIISVPCSLIISISLSLLLSRQRKGTGIFRTLIYLPALVPTIATAIMWRGIYNYHGGLFNAIGGFLGIEPVNWLGYEYVKAAVIIMILWASTGGILIKIAAIKAIPEDLFEAAHIEGAGPFTRTFKITLPMISNMLYMNILTSIIAIFQLFGQVVLLAGQTSSGADSLTAVPIRPVYTYMVHVYQQIFVNMRFGYGMAMVWVIFAVIMIVTGIMEYTKKFWVYKEV